MLVVPITQPFVVRTLLSSGIDRSFVPSSLALGVRSSCEMRCVVSDGWAKTHQFRLTDSFVSMLRLVAYAMMAWQ